MAPLTARQISGESNLEHELEKQMGCMAGFLQLFDRPQILSAKRLYSPKRLPAAGSTSPSEQSDASVMSYARDSSPEQYPSSPVDTPGRPVTPLPLPVFDFKEGLRTTWKLREAPRLSLDSRAVVDAKGKLRPRDIRTTPAANAADEDNDRQRRSPSVIVRLMGLETLPGGEPAKNAELRRSSSESRVPRDLSHWGVLHTDPSNAPEEMYRSRAPDLGEYRKPDAIPRNAIPSIQKKSFFEARDYFPEPKSGGCGSLYGEIEKRLRMRGIDEPAKDLETLKQILEALQLKGLLHTKPSAQPINGRCNIIYDPRIPRAAGESPIVSAKPISRPPAGRRPGSISPPIAPRSGSTRRNFSPEPTPPVRARRERSPRSPDHGSPSPPARRRPTNADPEKKTQQQRRIPAAHSPKPSPKRPIHDQRAVASPRNRRGTPENSHKERLYSSAEDDTSTVSSFSSSSHLDFERTRTEEYKAGRSLLERCDKLLHSIAAITSSAEQVSALDPQPSPVSVLDSSSFLGDESSPSPVLKRSLEFKDQLTEWEDTEWNQAIATVRSELGDGLEIEGLDFVYITEIIRASDQHQDSDVYLMLEKRRAEFDDGDEGRLHRRVLFDTVAEILDRKKHASALEPISRSKSAAVLRHVWVELRRLKAEPQSDDLNDATCRVIRNDMAGDHLWGDPSGEISDQVLQIERLLFKDLIADTIRDLGDLAAGRSRRATAVAPRRKLVF